MAQRSNQGIPNTYSQTQSIPSRMCPSLQSHRMIGGWDPAAETLNDFQSYRGDEPSSNSSAGALLVPHTAVLANSPNELVSQPEAIKPWVGRAQNSPSMESANSLIMLQQSIGSITDVCEAQNSAYATFQEPDLDWSTFLNLSPGIQPLNETRALAFASTKHSDPQNSFTYNPTSPLLREQTIRSHLVPQQDSRSRYDLASSSTGSCITLEGANPEDIVSPLQALESVFPMHLVRHDLEEYLYSDSHLASLLDMANSTWLHLEIEEILGWSYEMSARRLRQRQTSRQDYDSNIRPENSNHKSYHNAGRGRPDAQGMYNSQVFPSTKLRLKSSLTRVTPGGTLKVQLWKELQTHLNVGNPEPHDWLRVTFIPREDKRSKGVTVELPTAQSPFPRPRICPRIKAFNFVPSDSEVIRCVSRNDLSGLRKLFDDRKASPLDVDPRGYSLLSASLTVHDLVCNIDSNVPISI